jgi:hypothetical protein
MSSNSLKVQSKMRTLLDGFSRGRSSLKPPPDQSQPTLAIPQRGALARCLPQQQSSNKARCPPQQQPTAATRRLPQEDETPLLQRSRVFSKHKREEDEVEGVRVPRHVRIRVVGCRVGAASVSALSALDCEAGPQPP